VTAGRPATSPACRRAPHRRARPAGPPARRPRPASLPPRRASRRRVRRQRASDRTPTSAGGPTAPWHAPRNRRTAPPPRRSGTAVSAEWPAAAPSTRTGPWPPDGGALTAVGRAAVAAPAASHRARAASSRAMPGHRRRALPLSHPRRGGAHRRARHRADGRGAPRATPTPSRADPEFRATALGRKRPLREPLRRRRARSRATSTVPTGCRHRSCRRLPTPAPNIRPRRVGPLPRGRWVRRRRRRRRTGQGSLPDRFTFS
jgi:hypothetical protein